jgi:hypothetical protein
MESNFLKSALREFNHYKSLGEKAIAQMPEDRLFWAYNEETNSVAVIVKHLWGNMMSRWTDFLMTDGEKQWRQRDAEFENDLNSRKELMSKWDEGWACVFKALASLSDSDLDRTVYIRGEAHTVLEAINRQVAHYASHVGQIIWIAKIFASDWQTLSIPRKK